jgi:hypothetical protein
MEAWNGQSNLNFLLSNFSFKANCGRLKLESRERIGHPLSNCYLSISAFKTNL